MNPTIAISIVAILISSLLLINAWVIRHKSNKDRLHNLRKEAFLGAIECELEWQAILNKHFHSIYRLENESIPTHKTKMTVDYLKDIREVCVKSHDHAKSMRVKLESNLDKTSEKELRNLVITFSESKIRLNSINIELENKLGLLEKASSTISNKQNNLRSGGPLFGHSPALCARECPSQQGVKRFDPCGAARLGNKSLSTTNSPC